MQHPGVNVAEHAVAQAVAVEQRAEFDNIVSEIFRRDAGIFGKGDRLGRAFGVPQQAHRFFTHRIDTLDARQLVAHLPANDPAFAPGDQLVQTLAQSFDLAFYEFSVITGKLDDIQTQHLFVGYVGDQLADRMPDDIFPRQVEHFRVDGFYRQGAGIDHERCIAQRRVKGVVLHIHQTSHFRQTGDIKARLGDKGQRAFGAGQDAGQIELAEVII